AVIALPAGLVQRRGQPIAAALAIAVLLTGPAAYALDTMGTAYAGGDPSAGPQVASAGGRGGFGGFVGGGNGGPVGVARGALAGGPGGDAASSTLIDYLVANRGSATWIVAVTSANQAGS